MSNTYFWLAIIIIAFDFLLLGLNFKLHYHAHWSIARLVFAIIVSIFLIWVIATSETMTGVQTAVLGAFLITAIVFGLVRKGLGNKYALVTMGTAGLKDWRAFKEYRLEPVTKSQTRLILVGYGQREYRLILTETPDNLEAYIEPRLRRE